MLVLFFLNQKNIFVWCYYYFFLFSCGSCEVPAGQFFPAPYTVVQVAIEDHALFFLRFLSACKIEVSKSKDNTGTIQDDTAVGSTTIVPVQNDTIFISSINIIVK